MVIMENLRFYCLKVLRRKLTAKQIYDKYEESNDIRKI